VQEQQALEKRYSKKLDSAMLRLALSRIAKHADDNAKRILPMFLGRGRLTKRTSMRRSTDSTDQARRHEPGCDCSRPRVAEPPATGPVRPARVALGPLFRSATTARTPDGALA
jgi:hypothetical protein